MATPLASTRQPAAAPHAATQAAYRQHALAYWLGGAVAGLLVVAAAAGLFVPGLYRDPPATVAMDRGSDLVTLVLIVPALVGSLVLAAHGSLRARVLWLGLLGYVVYYYAIFAYGVRFNPLFLVYVALFGLGLFSLPLVLRQIVVDALPARFAPTLPVRAISGFLVFIAIGFTAVWLADILPATFSNGTPASVQTLQAPANAIEVNDLAVALPLMVLAGAWLWQRQARGYLLAGVMLVLSTAIALVLLPSPLFQYLDGQTVDWGQWPIGVVMGSGGLALLVVYLRNLREPTGAEG